MKSLKKRYRKKENVQVTAVRLDLDTEGLAYYKWGGLQHAKAGDWLVDSQGDCYTVDAESFSRTYRKLSPGVYQKIQTVWAEQAEADGSVKTREGRTDYRAGDYLVCNDPGGEDCYAVSRATFEENYEEVGA